MGTKIAAWKNILLFSILFISGGILVYSQCTEENYSNRCPVSITDYKYLKSRLINIKNKRDIEKSVYEITLSSGNDYLIQACELGQENHMIISLYDKNDKMISSNYAPGSNKLYSKILFPCKITDKYFVGFSFQDAQPGCGMGIISFKSSNKKK